MGTWGQFQAERAACIKVQWGERVITRIISYRCHRHSQRSGPQRLLRPDHLRVCSLERHFYFHLKCLGELLKGLMQENGLRKFVFWNEYSGLEDSTGG